MRAELGKESVVLWNVLPFLSNLEYFLSLNETYHIFRPATLPEQPAGRRVITCLKMLQTGSDVLSERLTDLPITYDAFKSQPASVTSRFCGQTCDAVTLPCSMFTVDLFIWNIALFCLYVKMQSVKKSIAIRGERVALQLLNPREVCEWRVQHNHNPVLPVCCWSRCP